MKCHYCRNPLCKKPEYLIKDKVFYVTCKICYGVHRENQRQEEILEDMQALDIPKRGNWIAYVYYPKRLM